MATEYETPGWYHYVGITLALTSGLFIGSSFIFKKKGLLDTKKDHGELGDGHQYLNSPMWWTGMILMALGEVFNFVAYAFSPAILVTPLGAISVVISAILSEIFLNEKLNFSGKIGCAQCIIGAVLIVLHAPESNSSDTIEEFFAYATSPLFEVYAILCGGAIFYLITKVAPEHGEKNPMVYISICSLVGSFLVLSCQGFGSSVAWTFSHWDTENQFLDWRIYPLIGFIILTVIGQIHFLNKALNTFSTAIVTPVYYVSFTACTLCSSAVLFRGFTVESTMHGVSLVMGFLVIVGGVSLLFEYNDRVARGSIVMGGGKALRRAVAAHQAKERSEGALLSGTGINDFEDQVESGSENLLPRAKGSLSKKREIIKSGMNTVVQMENVDRSRAASEEVTKPLNPFGVE